MKKISLCVAMAFALLSQANAQQTLYFGGAPGWNKIQMTTAEGKEIPYIASGRYAAWVLLTDEAKKISTSDYKGVKLQYENHKAGEKNALMLVNVIPEGAENTQDKQQYTKVAEGDQTVTVEFTDVVKDKTISALRLWAPEKGIQILLKKVWLIKNDGTEEEQNFSLLWGGWNWCKLAQTSPQLTFPVQYCGQFVCDSETCNLATYSALSNESQEYHLELEEVLTNPVTVLPNYLYKETNNGKEETKEGTFTYSISVPAGVTEYTFTLDRDKVTEWASNAGKAPVVNKIVFQNNAEIKAPFTMKIKSLTRTSILNMPSSGFATFCASYPVNYGSLEGLEAYAVKLNADTKTITLKKIEGVVPAGKAVLLKGTPNKAYRLTTGEGAEVKFDTDLKVSDGTATSTDKTAVYGLATVDGQDGFYKASGEQKIPAKCGYLEVAKTAGAAFFSLGDITGNTTGIADVKAETVKADAQMYNLAGQKVGKGYKGIVIKNGKKMILK